MNKSNFRKLLPGTGGGIFLVIFGYATLVISLINIQSYYATMNLPGYSSTLAFIQIVMVVINLVVIVGVTKYNRRWLENVATLVLALIFILQVGMIVGSGI